MKLLEGQLEDAASENVAKPGTPYTMAKVQPQADAGCKGWWGDAGKKGSGWGKGGGGKGQKGSWKK